MRAFFSGNILESGLSLPDGDSFVFALLFVDVLALVARAAMPPFRGLCNGIITVHNLGK